MSDTFGIVWPRRDGYYWIRQGNLWTLVRVERGRGHFVVNGQEIASLPELNYLGPCDPPDPNSYGDEKADPQCTLATFDPKMSEPK